MTSLMSPPTFKEVCNHSIRNGAATVKELIGLHHVEQFNFTDLTGKILRCSKENAQTFLTANALKHPYELCFYRFHLPNDDDHDDNKHSISLLVQSGKLIPYLSEEYENSAYIMMFSRNTSTGKCFYVGSGIMSVKDNELCYDTLFDDNARFAALCVSLYTPLLGLLYTKGITTERKAPCAKQNKARAKANKSLLPYVTTVSLASYRQATEHQGGTHASPRPHLRRAHIRRIAKDDSGKLIPVAAALVNWDGSPLMRTEYQVRS